MTVAEFAAAAMEYCALTGASVTSWGRTQARNRAVGGVPVSAHRFFRAVDVVYDGPTDKVQCRIIAARLGLLLLPEDDHDHLQPADWPRG